MRTCLLILLLCWPALAAPAVLTFAEVGEIKSATFTGKTAGASEGLRIQAGPYPLGRWDGDGGRWNDEYPPLKQFLTPQSRLTLTSGVNKLVEMRHDPKQLTLKTASGKTFTFTVPAITVTREGRYLLDNGKSLKGGSLFLGNDGKCYLDEKAAQPAGP